MVKSLMILHITQIHARDFSVFLSRNSRTRTGLPQSAFLSGWQSPFYWFGVFFLGLNRYFIHLDRRKCSVVFYVNLNYFKLV